MIQAKSDIKLSEKKPLVSIIMNCFNGEQFIEDAIESILAQTYDNWELIFWDNQSTDKSAAVINSYKDERIKYFCSENHTILYEARGYAYAKTKGELIAFLDVDDIWYPAKLEKQVRLFEDKEIGFVCSNYHNWNTEKNSRTLAFRDTLAGGYVLDELLSHYFVGMLTLVLRRDSFESLEVQFDPRFQIIGDFDLVIRMSSKWKLGIVQTPMACYRIHLGNESRKQRHRTVRETLEWYREYEKDQIIGASKYFKKVKLRIAYVKAIALILDNQKISALKCLGTMTLGDSIKTIIAVIIPLRIINILR